METRKHTRTTERMGWQAQVLSKLRCHKSGLEQALEDVRMGRVSPIFTNVQDAIKWLHN